MCVCVSPWCLFSSPPAVPAVLVSSTPGYLFARRLDELQTHTYTQDYLALLCICVFPPGPCLGPSGPLPCFPSATCVVTAKDSHLQPSPEKALGPRSCPTGRQMPANDPFHLSSGTRVSVPSRLLVWGQAPIQAICNGFTSAALAGAPPACLPQCLHSPWFSMEHCVPQSPVTICPSLTGHDHFCFVEEEKCLTFA